MKRSPFLVLAALAAMAVSCSRFHRHHDEDQPATIAEPDAATQEQAAAPQSDANSGEPPIEFTATGEGNSVRFTLINHAAPDLYVGPLNLALISPPSQDIIHVSDRDQALVRFYPKALAMDEGIAGEIVFLQLESVVGRRLVFNSNQISQQFWRADIQPAAPHGEETTAVEASPSA